MRLSLTPSALPPVRPGAAAAASGSRAAARKLAVLTFTALLLAGTVSPSAASPHASGAPAVADTLRVTLAAPEGGSVAEGSEDSFEVSVAGSTSDGAVTVRYSVSGTATAGTDYQALAGEVTVAKGENSARIVLSALDDDILDDGETVVLALTGASGATTVVVDSTPATATIADHGTVTVEITPMNDTLPEGAAWNSTVTLSSAVAARVSVGWRTSDGTAVAGSDYEGAVGSAVFEPGERSKTISVKTMEDDESEPVEMFYIALDATAAAAATAGGAGAGNGVRVDPQQRFGFIQCSVEFPDGRIVRAVDENAPAGSRVGAPVTAATESIAFYRLRGGSGRFAIDDVSGQITTTESLDHEERSAYIVSVSVHDDCGASDTTNVTINVGNVNEAPTAKAGDDQEDVPTGTTVTLSGTSEDLDGDDATWGTPSHDFAWVQTEGPIPDGGLNDADKATATFKAPSVTETTDLVFELTVTDGGSLSHTDAVTVTVEPPENKPPEFPSATFDRSVAENSGEGAAVGAPVTATDEDGDKLSYTLADDGDDALFDVHNETGQITVARGTVLDYEGGKTVYTVYVVASDGSLSDKATVTIRVTDVPPPGRPAKPTVTGGDEQVSVSWRAPANRGPAISDYDLRYRASTASRWSELSSLGVGLSHTVKNLSVATTYLVQVRAVSAEGEGAWSASGQGTTAEPVNRAPIFDPDKVERRIPENSGEDAAVGAPVTATDEDGDELSYTLADDGDDALFDVHDKTGQITVARGTVLDYEGGKTVYTVYVVASDGSLSDKVTVTIRVTDVPPPDKPAPPTVKGGDEQVSVSWRAPASRGSAITDYDLRYRASTASRWSEVSSLGVGLSYTVTNLSAATTYLVQVRAVSAEGAGAWSASGQGTTAEPVNRAPIFDPDKVERKVPENSGEGAAVGAPVTATDEDGDDLSYTLADDGDDALFDVHDKTGQITVAKGTVLDYEGGKTVYTVYVVASDGALTDRATVTIRVTDVPPPGRPARPTVTGGDEQVSVSWRAPANRGPAITDYDLRYRASTASSWSEVSSLGVGLSHTVKNLSSATTYLVQVRAESAEGEGAWSQSGQGTTAEPSNEDPDADAGPDQTVDEGDRVDLDGTGSSDSDGTVEEYAWTQRSGPAVTLYNADTAAPHFWAPAVTSTTYLRFRLTVEDDDEATDTDDVTITVEPVTDCSITSVADGNFTVGEDATAVGTVGVNANDCGALDYGLAGAGANDVFAAAVSGSSDDAAITGNFNFEGRSSYDLTLTVSERGGSASLSGRLRISVTDVNEAPKATGSIGRQTIRVGRPGSVNVTNYFTDEDAGDRLTFSARSSATGRLTVSASGSPVTLTGVAVGSATVTVTARDRAGLTATQTFPVTIEPAPKPCGITVSNGALSVPENARVGDGVDGKVGVTTTGDCGTLSYGLSGTGSGDFSVAAASASDDDGKIKVKGALNHEGRDAYDLTLTVSEVGGAASGAGDVDITVTDVNEAPKANGAISRQTVRVGRPGSVDVTGYFTDEDAGDRLTFTSESSATGRLTVNASGSPVTLTGVAPGSATVTVTARDRAGLKATQVFSVTVEPKPTTPCAITVSDGALSVPEDAGVGAGVDGKVGVTTKGDCGTLGYALSGDGAADFAVAAVGSGDNDAKISVAKTLDHETKASYALKLTVSEAGGDASAEGDVAISVTDVNEKPVVESAIPALTVAAGKTAVVDVSGRFRDPDDDALTYEAESSSEAAATVKVNGSEITVTGVSPGESRVTVTARDARGGSVSQTFQVTVKNQAPVVESAIPALTVSAGDAKVVDVSAHFSDPNGDALTYEAESSREAAATVKVSGSEITVTGVSPGESLVTVTARDTHDATVSQKFTVTVGPANDPPVIESAIPALTVEAGTTAVVEVSGRFSDPDKDALTYEAESLDDAVATATASGSEVRVTGVSRGESRVTVTALDGRGGSVSQDFAVTVPNRAPEAVGSLGRRTVGQGGLVWIGVSHGFRDPDGDSLTYQASSSDEGVVTASAAPGQVLVRAIWRGSATVTVTVDDGHGGTAEQAFEVEVPNRAPLTLGPIASRTIPRGERVTVGLKNKFHDPDRDKLSYTAVADDTAVVALSVDGAELTVEGLAKGRTEVVVRADDGLGGSASRQFRVTVTNGPPSFEDDAYEREVAENSAAGTAVGTPVAATDGDGDDLTYSFVSGGDEALFGIDAASGQIEVGEGTTLDYESGNTVYAVSVRASDGTLADTAAVTIRVTDVPAPGKPDAPVVTGGTGELAVSWSAPENEGPEIADYDLRYRAKSDSGWTDVSALGAVLAHTIAGLDAGTTYEVQVRAISSEGAGDWSEPGEGTTKTANKAPSFDAETYERSVAENSPAGTTVGDPVTATDDNDDELTYSFASGGDETPFEIDAATGQIAVAKGAALDYEGGTTAYTLTVRASDGALEATAAVTIQVTDVPAPGKPAAPVVTGGTEEVAVSWSAPSNEGPAITGYHLRYRAGADGEWTTPTTLGAVLAHTITGLEGGTTYSVQVRAISPEGAGEWSDPGAGAVEPANQAPSFDAETYEREVPENSAAGTAVGDPVTATDDDTDDELTYNFVSGGDEAPFEIDAATGQIAVAKGATLDYEGGTTVYTVTVRASDGTLAATAAVTIQVTDVPAPGKPAAPVVTGGTEEVAVTWSAPSNEGPEITGYHLRYRAGADGEWSVPTALGVVLAHTIAGLDAETAYSVQVRAENSEGAGEWSEAGEGTTEAANRAPEFDTDAYEREVPENSAPGTAVGEPVTATDDGEELTYSLVAEDEAPFEIDAASGQIAVAEGAALNYESGDTLFTVSVEASDGELAATVPVKIRVTNADEPGKVVLSPEVARVGVELTATLMDEERGAERGQTAQVAAVGGRRLVERHRHGPDVQPGDGRCGPVAARGVHLRRRPRAGQAGGERRGQGAGRERGARLRRGHVRARGAGELGGRHERGRTRHGDRRRRRRPDVCLRPRRSRGLVRDRRVNRPDHSGRGRGAELRERGHAVHGARRGQRRRTRRHGLRQDSGDERGRSGQGHAEPGGGAGGRRAYRDADGRGRRAQRGQDAQVAALGGRQFLERHRHGPDVQPRDERRGPVAAGGVHLRGRARAGQAGSERGGEGAGRERGALVRRRVRARGARELPGRHEGRRAGGGYRLRQPHPVLRVRPGRRREPVRDR